MHAQNDASRRPRLLHVLSCNLVSHVALLSGFLHRFSGRAQHLSIGLVDNHLFCFLKYHLIITNDANLDLVHPFDGRAFPAGQLCECRLVGGKGMGRNRAKLMSVGMTDICFYSVSFLRLPNQLQASVIISLEVAVRGAPSITN